MKRRLRVIKPEQEEQRDHRQQAGEESRAAPVALSTTAPMLADTRLSSASNAAPRAHLIRAGQQVAGNAALQRVLQQAELSSPQGQALPPALRREMEETLGADLGRVRLHTGAAADALSRAAGARACAAGPDLYFRQGAYAPAQLAGRRLLLHELVHVVQSGASPAPVQQLTGPGEAAEREARAVAGQALAGRSLAVQQRLPAGALACGDEEEQQQAAPAPQPAAQALEQRAAAQDDNWRPLADTQRQQVLDLIRSRNGPAALAALWNAIRGDLPLAGRVTLQWTNALGTVGGQQVAPAGSASAIALCYVEGSTPPAPGAAAELRALIQVGPAVLERPPEEAVAVLHSTLMHEYTHAEQMAEQGIPAQATFRTVGNRHFVLEPPSPEQRRREGLEEIEATCAEIENAANTELDEALNIREVVNYLWSMYRQYYNNCGQNPNPAVAARVLANIERGRQLYVDYLQQDALRSRPRNFIESFARSTCPNGYNPAILEPFARSGSGGQ